MEEKIVLRLSWGEQHEERRKEGKKPGTPLEFFRCNVELNWRGYEIEGEVFSVISGGPAGMRTGFRFKVNGQGQYKISLGRTAMGGGIDRNLPDLSTKTHKLDFRIGVNGIRIIEKEIETESE